MTYIGMSSQPYIRKGQWESAGRQVQNFRIIKSGLYYHEAQDLENSLLTEYKRCCPHSEGHPGGRPVDGPVYSVYAYEY